MVYSWIKNGKKLGKTLTGSHQNFETEEVVFALFQGEQKNEFLKIIKVVEDKIYHISSLLKACSIFAFSSLQSSLKACIFQKIQLWFGKLFSSIFNL